MNAMIALSALLVLGVQANVLPRQVRTFLIGLPTQAEEFTTTVPGCGTTIAPLVVIGTPTGTFRAGSITVYGPPQADPTTTSIYDTANNETEVFVLEPLKGTCAEFPIPGIPSPASTSALTTLDAFSSASTSAFTTLDDFSTFIVPFPSPTPTPSGAACPDEKGCSGAVTRASGKIIDVINRVTLASQNLQLVAKLLGPGSVGDMGAVEADPTFLDIVRGFNDIIRTLTTSLPRLIFGFPLPPGCDTDTVVIALAQFVRVHQALLNTLIGKYGLLESSPIKRETIGEVVRLKRTPKTDVKGAESARIGSLVAQALRGIEAAVDTFALALIRLIPSRSECAKEQKDAIDATIKESIETYED